MFLVSPSMVMTLEGLTTSLKLKEDSENDTSGTQPTNTRGRELRPITFKTTYLAAAGVDPRAQIESWETDIGNANPLLIGGKRFGAAKMKLTQVATSDILLSVNGDFLKAVVSITLEEYSEGKSSELVNKSESAAKASATYNATVAAKKEALSTTASTTDKQELSKSGTSKPRGETARQGRG
jgi:hypothetical protein